MVPVGVFVSNCVSSLTAGSGADQGPFHKWLAVVAFSATEDNGDGEVTLEEFIAAWPTLQHPGHPAVVMAQATTNSLGSTCMAVAWLIGRPKNYL